jgi:hypothetical protein
MSVDSCQHGQLRRQCEICELIAERDALLARISAAPVAIMDTRHVLSLCAPDEAAFPALYALQGKRVRLVVETVN